MSVVELSKEEIGSIKTEVATIAKSEGLEILEDTAVALVKSAFKIIATVLPKVSPAVAAIVVPILALVEPRILAALDKIDGIDDAAY